eukprot:14759603-Alexandrium_andersonii.AAC.1
MPRPRPHPHRRERPRPPSLMRRVAQETFCQRTSVRVPNRCPARVQAGGAPGGGRPDQPPEI